MCAWLLVQLAERSLDLALIYRVKFPSFGAGMTFFCD